MPSIIGMRKLSTMEIPCQQLEMPPNDSGHATLLIMNLCT